MLRIVEFSLWASRFVLAAVFLLAGAGKLADPVGWRKALRDFSLPAWIAQPLMVLLPVLEPLVAAALVPASVRLVWSPRRFRAAHRLYDWRRLRHDPGRKPDCHCFGQLHSAPVGWTTLTRNGVLAVIAGWLASRAPRQLGPDLWAWYFTLGAEGRKVAAVAGCAAAFLFFRLLVRSRPRSESTESPLPAVDWGEDEPEEGPSVPIKRTTPRPAPRTAPQPAPEVPTPAANTAMGIGLAVGTPAPEFELPGINGVKRSSQSLRKQGADVLLVFLSPFCKPCDSVPSSLVRWARDVGRLPNIVLISRGTAQDNLPKLKEFGTSQVLLQRNSEVAEMYDCVATPAAVLVGADGRIRSELAQGGPAIRKLLSSSGKGNSPAAENIAESEPARL